MPTYEYICKDCGEVMEARMSLAEKEKGPKLKCPACGSSNMAQYFGNSIVIAATHLH